MFANSSHQYTRLDEGEPDDGGEGAGDLELQDRSRRSLNWSKSDLPDNTPSTSAGNGFHPDDYGGSYGGSGDRAGSDSDDDDHEYHDGRFNVMDGPRTFPQRWVQLFYLSTLALISDWVCFSTASIPDVFERAYPGRTSEGLIDKFLFMNVISCLLVTDIVARYGLQRCTKASSLLMAVGCWLRCGFSIVPVVMEMIGVREIVEEDYVGLDYSEKNPAFGRRRLLEHPDFGLPPYPVLVIGTLMVGMAQPFFQCTPPLLSAQWFASNERATSSAIALNFNQVGIAVAFVVAGEMADGYRGLMRYFSLIAVLSTALSVGTLMHFQDLPPIPPSASEFEKLAKSRSHAEPPFRVSLRNFLATPGFLRPLLAFVCSIAITNVVGAFIDEVMGRGGITDRKYVAWSGAGFEMAIVLGGIILGNYVDRTKQYKNVTLWCLLASLVCLLPLGLTDHQLGKEPVLLVVSLLLLGFFVGPVQPINAELAVDVTYPGDETAVESIQQFGGNFCSAIFVPVAGRAAKLDYQILPRIKYLASDIRGDVIFMMLMSVGTYCFYRSFNAPLRRTMADGD